MPAKGLASRWTRSEKLKRAGATVFIDLPSYSIHPSSTETMASVENLNLVALPFIRSAEEALVDPVIKSGLKIATACAEGCQASLIQALLDHIWLLEGNIKYKELSNKEALAYWTAEADSQSMRADAAEAEKKQLAERTLAAEAEAARQMRLKEAARAETDAESSRADDLADILDNVRRAHAKDVGTLRAENDALRMRNAEMFLELQVNGNQETPSNVPEDTAPALDIWDDMEEAHARRWENELCGEHPSAYDYGASPESRSDEE